MPWQSSTSACTASRQLELVSRRSLPASPPGLTSTCASTHAPLLGSSSISTSITPRLDLNLNLPRARAPRPRARAQSMPPRSTSISAAVVPRLNLDPYQSPRAILGLELLSLPSSPLARPRTFSAPARHPRARAPLHCRHPLPLPDSTSTSARAIPGHELLSARDAPNRLDIDLRSCCPRGFSSIFAHAALRSFGEELADVAKEEVADLPVPCLPPT
ncbi:hypothetical protein E2562_014979 [Oryza meyeriana var. granulata]|uniref:Uncharacterized protein n=1 Tax=Oryza meyeriana var. granulata TaxID=110450 RepID=A0A6G1EJQ4_9ORYZ|nr:hypothetical protein E2562_014979 [Oryza meyeriana var. granulata]